MISRDWHCMNPQCDNVFHSFEKGNPPCPACGCVKVDWMPGGGHILTGKTRRMDARLDSIARQHGVTNLNSPSPSRVNRAAPVLPPKPISPEAGVRHWGMGITSAVSLHGAVAVEAASPIDLRGKLAIGTHAAPNPASASVPGPMANTIIEGRTKQRTI